MASFQIDSGATGNSIMHQVRSGYDAYYDHTVARMNPQAPHVIRSYNGKYTSYNINTYTDVNVWEAINGRPVPPTAPFGSFYFRYPQSIEEWKNNGYKILLPSYALFAAYVFGNHKHLGYGKPMERRMAAAWRRLYGSFVHVLIGGLVWINYVAYTKERSPAKLYHQMSNGERVKLSILLGVVTGLLEKKDSAPWYGGYPRLSIIYERVRLYFLAYGVLYTVGIHIYLHRTLTHQHTNPHSPIYNVLPWWWEKDSLPYHHFDGTQIYRTLNYRQQKQLPVFNDVDVVDEYSVLTAGPMVKNAKTL